MPKYSVLRNFGRLTEGSLGDFGLHIGTKMTGNTNFTTPPFPIPSLITATNNFNTSVAACVNGTPLDTVNKLNLATALLALLNQLATYVELTANNDPAKILSSGFSLASTSRTPLAPGMTSISAVTNVASGKLGLAVAVADNAWAYIVEYTNLTTNAVKTLVFTDPHGMVLTGLTPGVNYSIRVQVMGSGNQTTEFCDAVTHMAT
jgi:hypothetical protein